MIFKLVLKFDGQDAVKIMAKDLVRTRNYVKKFMLMKANLQGVAVKMLTLQSQQAIGEAVLHVTIALRAMNRLQDLVFF